MTIGEACDIISECSRAYAPVAQLDRVTDYESVGQGFESLPAYQNLESQDSRFFFYFLGLQSTASAELLRILPKTTVIARPVGPWQSPDTQNQQRMRRRYAEPLTPRIYEGGQGVRCLPLVWRLSPLNTRRLPEGELPRRGKRGHPGVRGFAPRNDSGGRGVGADSHWCVDFGGWYCAAVMTVPYGKRSPHFVAVHFPYFPRFPGEYPLK